MDIARTGSLPRRIGRLLLILTAWSLPAVTLPSSPAFFSGTISDALGNALSGVEVLVLSPGDLTKPIVVTHSDDRGAFSISKLSPGSYKVAAVKSGYLTFVGRVDTLIQTSLDVVLRPSLQTGQDATIRLPEDPSWALRLPRRGILREVEGETPTVREAMESRAVAERGNDPTRLRLEQLFSVVAGPDDHRSASAELRATETRMALDSSLGERGNLSLRGRSERLASSKSSDRDLAAASTEAASMRVDLSYATSTQGQLAINAFYSQNGYELTDAARGLAPAIQREQRTWGYNAEWSRQLDDRSRVAVKLDYQDVSLDHPQIGGGQLPTGAPDSPSTFSNRAVGAEGMFERVKSERHEVQLALRAQLLRRPTNVSGNVARHAAVPEAEVSDWTLQMQARDTFSISGPFTLVYGLGYKQALVSSESRLLAPLFGGSWADDGWRISAQLSYHAASNDRTPEGGDLWSSFRPERSVGYQARIEVPIVDGIHLEGGAGYSPIQFDYFGSGRESFALDGHPLYITDGNSSVQENRVALVKDRGRSQTYLEFVHGRAEGNLASLMPFDSSYPTLSDRDLRYRNASFGVRVPSRGTDVLVEYQKVVASLASSLASPAGSVQESVEFRVRQNLWAMHSAGDWRLLLALHMGSVDSDDLESWESRGGDEDTLEALNRRISAGVSVLF